MKVSMLNPVRVKVKLLLVLQIISGRSQNSSSTLAGKMVNFNLCLLNMYTYLGNPLILSKIGQETVWPDLDQWHLQPLNQAGNANIFFL